MRSGGAATPPVKTATSATAAPIAARTTSANSSPKSPEPSPALAEEAQQLAVDLLRVRPGQAVRPALHHHEPASLDQLMGARTGRGEGEDAVGVPMMHLAGR